MNWPYDSPRDRPSRYAPRILDDPAIQQNVRRLVMRFIPGLIVFVTQTKVECELGRKLEIILDVPPPPPLPIADDPDGRAQPAFVGPIQDEICRTISSTAGRHIGIA